MTGLILTRASASRRTAGAAEFEIEPARR